MKKFSRILSLLLVICMVFSLLPMVFAAEKYDGIGSGKTVILHSNDVHGAVTGYAYIAALKNKLVAAGAEVILADAGDYSQGETAVSLSKGATAVEMMNATGYDVVGLGNHEFDYGYAQLKENMTKAHFEVLCSDVLDADGNPIFDAHIVIEKGGVKIGFFGLETPETQTKANPALIKGLTFLTETTELTIWQNAQAQVDALKTEGADIVVCLSHLGVDKSSEPYRSYDLYSKVTGIDFIIDAHSHTVMEKGEKDEPIQSTGTKFANIGVIVIDNATKKIEQNFLIPTGEGNFNEKDETVLAKAQGILDAIKAEYGQKFATSEVDLNGAKEPGNRTEETNNGDLITDAMVWYLTEKNPGSITEVDADHIVAITNGGGIRAAVKQGDVTKNDIFTVLPFGNTVAVVYVTGAELLEALEASTYCTPASLGGFPQVAGLKFTVDADKAYDKNETTYPGSTYYGPKSINRVTIDEINGKAFDETAKYAVITNNFVAGGGDTYYAFAAASSQFDTGYTLDSVVIDYITEKLGGVIKADDYGTPKGRITVKQTPVVSDKITIGGLDANLWMTKYGNVYTDCKATDFLGEKLGFSWGDIVTVKFLDKELDLPVVPTYHYVDSGNPAIIVEKDADGKPTGYVSMAINMGNFATTYGIAEKHTNADKTWYWTAMEGVTFPIEVKFEMKEAGGYMAQYLLHDLNRTNNREDYADLTDEQFANFRVITTTGMGENILYRSSSPVNPELGRNTYADKAAEAAGVKTFVNLADDATKAAAYEGYAESYYSKQNVVFLNLGVDFTEQSFKDGLADGLRYMVEHEGPYLVHCTEGKDRAGYVSALLECFMGAKYTEVYSDYMTTYENYYGVEFGSEKYVAILESNIVKSLKNAFGVDNLETADLKKEATEYLKEIGLTDAEILKLAENLGGDPVVSEFEFLVTSDLHGQIFATDYTVDASQSGTYKRGLTRVSSYIKEQRALYGDNLYVVDMGDTIQGAPLTYYYAFNKPETDDPAIKAFRTIGYDMWVVGNHEFNYGLNILNRQLNYATSASTATEKQLSVSLANYLDATTNSDESKDWATWKGYDPYVIKDFDGVKVAIIGFGNPNVPTWDIPANWEGIYFADIIETYKKYEPEMKAKADMIVVVAHSGINSDVKSDFIGDLIEQTDSIAFAFSGHEHNNKDWTLKNAKGEDVHVLQPYTKARSIAQVKVSYDKATGEATVTPTLVNMENYKLDEDLVKVLQPYEDTTWNEYMLEKIGEASADFTAQELGTKPSAFMDLVNTVQLWGAYDNTGKNTPDNPKDDKPAQLSISAPLTSGDNANIINKGDIYLGDMFKLYRFENWFYQVTMKGEEIHQWLEFAATKIKVVNGKPTVSTGDLTYYDVIYGEGFSYVIDYTKEEGKRIVSMTYNGKEVTPDQTFTVVVNNYRYNGGGHYIEWLNAHGCEFKENDPDRIIYSTQFDMIQGEDKGQARNLLTDYIRTQKTITPTITSTWKLEPTVIALVPDSGNMFKYGHLDLDISTEEFLKLFEYGDIVTVTFNGKSYDFPVCSNYDDVDTHALLIRAATGKNVVTLAINYGQIGVEAGIIEKAPEGASAKYQVKEGVTFPIYATVTLKEAGGYKDELSVRQLNRTNNRDEYPTLTDEQFANFRSIATTGMGEKVLYRSSSPINPELGRNTYSDKAAAAAGIKTFVNLADTEAEAKGYEGFAESYYAKQNVIYLGLPVAFTTKEFKDGLAEGFRFMTKNEGPYLVHCTEGKDRAGLTAAILECFMGASAEEVANDYVTTFRNYYNVVDGKQAALTEAQETYLKNAILKNLCLIFGMEDATKADLKKEATEYLKEIGLTDAEIAKLAENLSGTVKEPFVNPFTDVSEKKWYYSYIMEMAEQGVVKGMTKTTFEPEGELTRAQAVMLLYRLAGEPEIEGTPSFKDVKENAWYADAIRWAEHTGVVNGMTKTTFEPESNVTRAQFVTMIYRFAGRPENKAAATFTDVKDGWYMDAVSWAETNQIVNGMTKTTFEPEGTCTRAQAAKIICVFLSLK